MLVKLNIIHLIYIKKNNLNIIFYNYIDISYKKKSGVSVFFIYPIIINFSVFIYKTIRVE